MNSNTNEQESLRSESKNNIESILDLGLFPISEVRGLPIMVVSSFNSVILNSGNCFGWSNKKKYLLDKNKVLEKFDASFDYYHDSYTQLSLTLKQETLEYLTPIVILNSACPNDTISRSSISFVFQHLALSYAGIAYNLLKPIIDNGEFLNTIKDHERLSQATCALLIAIEANYSGREQLFLANEQTKEKISRSEIDASLQLELIRHKKSVGGRGKKRHKELYKFVENFAKRKWLDEKSTGKNITFVPEMTLEALSKYKIEHKNDKDAEHVRNQTLRLKLGKIAKIIAPEASVRGRPKNP